MLALWIILAVLMVLIFVLMTAIMVIFERDKPRNIIIWSSVFLITQFLGYIIYFCSRAIFHKKKQSLYRKNNEDEIYLGLSANKIKVQKIEASDGIYKFNNLAYNSCVNSNSKFEIFSGLGDFLNSLVADINSANKSVLIELSKINLSDFAELKKAIIERAQANVLVKFVHDSTISLKTRRELKKAGVKLYRFSKHNTLGRVYANLRNMISVDGNIVYLGSLDFTSKQKKTKYEQAFAYIKFYGDVVQKMNMALYQDVIFAGGKYVEFPEVDERKFDNTKLQFVSNQIDTDIELLIINAICLAKKSIQLQLEEFVPTESIMSLLKCAINSNIKVNLMIPIHSNRHTKYFASRAYAKELALNGASVYLYDGFIRLNAITIDDSIVLTGAYILDREHIHTALQNVIIIEDNKAIKYYNDLFNSCIDNSYHISNAKYMLLREKFFKSIV